MYTDSYIVLHCNCIPNPIEFIFLAHFLLFLNVYCLSRHYAVGRIWENRIEYSSIAEIRNSVELLMRCTYSKLYVNLMLYGAAHSTSAFIFFLGKTDSSFSLLKLEKLFAWRKPPAIPPFGSHKCGELNMQSWSYVHKIIIHKYII